MNPLALWTFAKSPFGYISVVCLIGFAAMIYGYNQAAKICNANELRQEIAVLKKAHEIADKGRAAADAEAGRLRERKAEIVTIYEETVREMAGPVLLIDTCPLDPMAIESIWDSLNRQRQ